MKMIKENKAISIFLVLIGLFTLYFSIKYSYRIFSYIDGIGYYCYLPEYIIKHNFAYYTKFTLGVALCDLPAFLICNAIVLHTCPELANGCTPIYGYGVAVTATIFFILGLIVAYSLVKQVYNKKISFFVVIIISLATAIAGYATVYSDFSHIYTFLFTCLFAKKCWKIKNEECGFRDNFLLGLYAVMIFLIRNLNVLFLLYYFFLELEGSSFVETLKRILNPRRLIGNCLGVLILLVPQVLVWKHTTGEFLPRTYKGESFDYLLNPKIFQVLFSGEKGLFVYAPVFFFILIGIVCLYKNKKYALATGSLLVFLFELYATAAWWCWWLGATFGQRGFLDVLAFMLIPLGEFLVCLNKLKTKSSLGRILYYIALLLILASVFVNIICIQGVLKGCIDGYLGSYKQVLYALSHFWRMF